MFEEVKEEVVATEEAEVVEEVTPEVTEEAEVVAPTEEVA
jgi:hypothetical protein